MTGAPRINYTKRPGANLEGEIATLADVYLFILQSGGKRHTEEGQKKAAGRLESSGGHESEESENARSDKEIIPTR